MTLFDGKDQSVEPTLDTVKAKFTKEDGTIDVDGLLNKALHADKHIPTIEGENANLRKEVDSRLNYQDLLDRLESHRVQSASSSNPDPDTNERDEGTTITEDRISAMLDEKLTRKQQEALQASNVQYAKRELANALGTDWVQKLAKMAPDLDMTQQEIEYLAATKPKALLRMVVPQVEKRQDQSYAPPASRMNTNAMSTSTEKNNSYYQDKLRKNPKLAGDSRFVAEQMANAKKLGEAFFN
jgi:hypothetical protein